MKNKMIKLFVSFQKNFLQVEEFGGINEDYIFFNPDKKEGYKIQLLEKVFVAEKGTNKLINIIDYEPSFSIINSNDLVIASSDNLNPEFVDLMIDKIINIDHEYN